MLPIKKPVFDYKRMAKSNSYGASRSLNSIEGLVIHMTGAGGNDTAKNNADYFATGNTRSAGAHIFIDYEGNTSLSIPLRRTAWSVGNPGGAYKRGAYFAMLNNSNTVSIELCAIDNRPVSQKQRDALMNVSRWVKKKCPNLKYIVRHYDIVQKDCPHYYVKNQGAWLNLQLDILVAIGGI